jgi:LysM repeat protein
MDGLEDSVLPNFKLYTWREGDSYRLVSNTYYGDWKLLTLLRDANAGREDLQPGDRIMVPVYADASVPPAAEGNGTIADVEPQAAPVVEQPVAKPAKKETKAAASNTKSAAAKTTGGKVHVVKSGESLWTIAKKELGDGSRWKEIQQLNGLAKPEAIKVGMKLKLP